MLITYIASVLSHPSTLLRCEHILTPQSPRRTSSWEARCADVWHHCIHTPSLVLKYTFNPVCCAVSSTPSRNVLQARFSSVMPCPYIEPDVSSRRIVSNGIFQTRRKYVVADQTLICVRKLAPAHALKCTGIGHAAHTMGGAFICRWQNHRHGTLKAW